MPRSALLLATLLLSLLLGTGPARPATPSDSTIAPGAPGRSAAVLAPAVARHPGGAATDSARRAYRAWIARVRARALADSAAHADSLAAAGRAPRADSLADVDSLAAAAPSSPHDDYVARVRANFTPQNRDYATAQTALGFLGPLYGILLGLFVLFSGLAAWMRDIARNLSRRSYVQTLVYLALYLALAFVLEFPLVFFQDFALERQYGLMNQAFGPWLVDQLKALLVALVGFGVVPLLWLAYRPIRRFPRHWWLALGLGTLPVILAMAFLQPLVVDPLFNHFTPLADKRLEARILETTARAGIPARHVFQMDASRQSNRYNAYVSGFGVSQRVVLWDTTLKGMTPDEIVFVVSHEAAHYRLHHMWWGILFYTGLSFVLFGLASVLVRGAIARWGDRWGFGEPHDLASLPLFIVTLTLLGFLAQPGVNAFSRRIEHDADTYGLELTHANDAAARAFIKLGAQNRSDPEPTPVVELFQYSHPPLIERVRFAESYRPWQEGRPDRLFHPRR